MIHFEKLALDLASAAGIVFGVILLILSRRQIKSIFTWPFLKGGIIRTAIEVLCALGLVTIGVGLIGWGVYHLFHFNK
jgi:energy-converting hydrogenase Eha subunit C